MTKPEPLVPPECTMAGNDWYPLYFDRLRKSKWWRRATDLARARNVMLWGEAYKQVPAGSLPDDDDELAEAAGFGMDVEAFLAAKAEIMAPWVLCTDGRWYHPTVCEAVLEAWERAGERRRKDAARKAAQRARVKGQHPSSGDVTDKTIEVTPDDEQVTRDADENTRDFGTHNRQDITGQTEPPLPPEGGEQRGLGLEADPKPPRRRKASTPIPDGFPDERTITEEQLVARSAGADIDVAYHAQRFRNWAEARDQRQADWRACFRNWMLREVRDAPKTQARPAAPERPDGQWRKRALEFSRNRYWNELDWGPRPGREGCLCPPEIQREFGVEPAKPQPVKGAAA